MLQLTFITLIPALILLVPLSYQLITSIKAIKQREPVDVIKSSGIALALSLFLPLLATLISSTAISFLGDNPKLSAEAGAFLAWGYFVGVPVVLVLSPLLLIPAYIRSRRSHQLETSH